MDSNADRFIRSGAIFQFVAIVTFLFRRLYYSPQFSSALIALLVVAITVCGIGVFLWCLYVLYIRPRAKNTLITSGVFKYTRHPMYIAFIMMDIASFFSPLGIDLIFSTLLFYGSLITAGYFQEQETLARFGNAAREYYKCTPRLPIDIT